MRYVCGGLSNSFPCQLAYGYNIIVCLFHAYYYAFDTAALGFPDFEDAIIANNTARFSVFRTIYVIK